MKIKFIYEMIINESIEMKQLANDILDFLDKYASISPNYNPDFDDDDDKYTGPDPGQLKIAAIKLKNGQKPNRVWSEWGSGCYKPYNSADGRKIHDDLLKRINNLK